MELGEFTDCLLMECLSIWCLMEIQVASEYLISTFAREHHFDTHRLDDTGKEVHRCRGTYRGDIIRLDEIDNITQGIKTFLNGIVDLMMHRTDMISDKSCLCQVRSPLQSHCEGMQTGPVCLRLGVVLNTHLGITLRNGGDDRGIETATEQYAVWDIRHQLTLDGCPQCLTDILRTCPVILHGIIQHPVTVVVAF